MGHRHGRRRSEQTAFPTLPCGIQPQIDRFIGNRGFLIVAVRRGDGSVVVDPPGDCPLSAGDAVIVLGHSNDIPELAQKYTDTREIFYRGARMRMSS